MSRNLNPTSPDGDGPIDPVLESMLNEALAPGELPTGLIDRILTATVNKLPAGVIARIGVRRLRWAAAIVFLVGWTGIWMTVGLIVKDAHHLVVVHSDLNHVATLVNDYQGKTDDIEQQIGALTERFESADTFARLEATNQSLDEALRAWNSQLAEDDHSQF
jgi:hypothetical protein